jgi:hypothetical protein
MNWWIHGDTLEIHFTLSQQPEFDITSGIVHLLSALDNEELSYLKINLEFERKLTLIRLLAFGPKTYRNGYQTTLLFKPIR